MLRSQLARPALATVVAVAAAVAGVPHLPSTGFTQSVTEATSSGSTVTLTGVAELFGRVRSTDKVVFEAQLFERVAGVASGPAVATTRIQGFTAATRSTAVYSFTAATWHDYVVHFRPVTASGRGSVTAKMPVVARGDRSVNLPTRTLSWGSPIRGTLRGDMNTPVRYGRVSAIETSCSGPVSGPVRSASSFPLKADGTFEVPTITGHCYALHPSDAGFQLIPGQSRVKAGTQDLVVRPRLATTVELRTTSGTTSTNTLWVSVRSGSAYPWHTPVTVTNGTVTVYEGDAVLGRADVSQGRAAVSVTRRLGWGTHYLRLSYSDSGTFSSAESTAVLDVKGSNS